MSVPNRPGDGHSPRFSQLDQPDERTNPMRRHLARFLVLLIVPLFVTLQTEAADAAWGIRDDWVVSQSLTDGMTGPDIGGWTFTCSGSAAYETGAGGQYRISGKVKCNVDVRFYNDPDPGELGGRLAITSSGVTEDDGEYCGYIFQQLLGDPLTTQSYSSEYTDTDCLVDTICLTAGATDPRELSPFSSYGIDHQCATVNLGALPQNKGGCPYGSPLSASPLTVDGSPSGYAGYYARNIMVDFAGAGSDNPWVQPGQIWRHWGMEVKTFTGGQPQTDGYWFKGETANEPHIGESWVSERTWQRRGPGPGNLTQSPDRPHGVWLYIKAAQYGPDEPPQFDPPLKPRSDYQWGDTDVDNCVFYFGPKFRDDPNSERDDPYGEINVALPEPVEETEEPDLDPVEPVDPTETGDRCDFSFTNPTTWISAGICQLVELVRSLVGAVRNLPGRIAEAFADLFVPDEGFIDGKLEDLQDSFDDSTLGNYLDVITGLAPSGSSSCAGPSVNLNVGGASYSGNPLSACSGPLASAATLSRLAISIGVFLSAGFACVRILGRSLGWDPGLGGES